MARSIAICLATLAAGLAGCAVTPVPIEQPVNRIDVDSYRLLADLARLRQQGPQAAEYYLSAALASNDPRLAQIAAESAYEFGLDAEGHRAVARWRALDPEHPRADYLSGIFQMRSGRPADAVEDFSRLLDSLTPAELGTGFIVILDALSNEPTAVIAATVMLELTSRYPETREGHYGLAQLAMRAGGFGLALEEAQAAIEIDPDWPEARLLHARALLLAGRSDEALEIASELADQFNNSEIRLQFAELLLSAGETQAAETLLNEILAEDPGLPEAVRALAFLYLTDENLDVAREQFEMLRNNPDYRNEAFYYLGRIAELESNYLQATRSYSRVTDGIRAVEAQIRTGTILYQEMDDADSALRHLREFGNANPRFAPEMLLARAELLLDMDRAEEAIQMIDEAIGDDGALADQSLQNAHVQFYSTLMQDAIDGSDLVAAEAWITEGLMRYPGNQTLRYSQSMLLQEQGRLRRAVGVLEDLVDESPNNPAFLNALGYLLTDRLDRHTEAREYIQRALAMNPDSGAILDSMGWVLFRLGELDLALDYLERAIRSLETTDFAAINEVMAHLIDVHWALGNEALARRMLEEGLSASPQDRYLTEVRDRLLP